MRVDDAVIDEIRSRARIEDIVGQTVNLKPDGSGRMKGLCPFHDEKSPSFKVDKARGRYHCFGCGADGDVFEFLQQSQGLSFRDTVEVLAQKTGVAIPEPDPELDRKRRANQRLSDAVKAANDFYQEALLSPDAHHARAELSSRGFGRDHATSHGCGWAPSGGTALVQHLRAERFTPAEMISAGLAVDGRRGLRDFFRDRLVWPIADSSGRVVGFSGRRLASNDTGGKYINSPATTLFQKSSLLYRLHEARRRATRTGKLFIVEGYTDVMAVEDVGEAAAATCGTALTEDHVRVLQRLLPDGVKIIFAFDGDAAGQGAMVKAWEVAQPLLDRAETASLAGGDPCDLWGQDGGPEALSAALAATEPLTAAAVNAVVQHELGSDPTPDSRVRAARAAITLLGRAADSNAPLMAAYRDHVAVTAGLDIPTSWWGAGTVQQPSAPAHRSPRRAPRENSPAQLSREQAFWSLVVSTGDLQWLDVVDPTWFVTIPGAAFWDAIGNGLDQIPEQARVWALRSSVTAAEGAGVVAQVQIAHLRRRQDQLRGQLTTSATADEADAIAAELDRVRHDLQALQNR